MLLRRLGRCSEDMLDLKGIVARVSVSSSLLRCSGGRSSGFPDAGSWGKPTPHCDAADNRLF